MKQHSANGTQNNVCRPSEGVVLRYLEVKDALRVKSSAYVSKDTVPYLKYLKIILRNLKNLLFYFFCLLAGRWHVEDRFENLLQFFSSVKANDGPIHCLFILHKYAKSFYKTKHKG